MPTRFRFILRAVVYKVRIFILDGLLRPVRPQDMVRFGTHYGGWWIPEVDPSKGVAVCVGAGLDVSFDVELDRLGYNVYAVDPTPAAVEYVKKNAPQLTLVPVGIWDSECELVFSQDSRWSDSWYAKEINSEVQSVHEESFPVTTLKRLFERIDETDIAILKLDIEGAEHRVIRTIIADNLKPDTLCIEFDDQRLRTVLASTRSLSRYGYDLLQIENFNFIFALRSDT